MSDAPVDAELSLNTAHGARVPRGLAGGGASGHGRFGRMFPGLPACELPDCGIEALLTVMDAIPSIGRNERIPAGFTYLGQFVDHDITFDPNSQLDRINDPAALVNFRSPRLDLDSVYGSGPADQPFLYTWTDREGRPLADPGVEFLIAKTRDGKATIEDLPRNGERPSRALIGDPRNDVHIILAQLHLVFLKFHNRVVAYLREPGRRPRLRGSELFSEACRLVRWHYQWIVVNDFLPRVVGDETMQSVLNPAGVWPRVARRHYRWERDPFIPVEFSGAAYRFGHSMVRGSYRLKRPSLPDSPDGLSLVAPDEAGKKPGLAIFADPPAVADPDAPVLERPQLAGFRQLTADVQLEWFRFFDIDPGFPPQPSMTIDQGISVSLTKLPSAVASDTSLPRLNLKRGRSLGLPSGQDVARAMGERAPLSADELFPGNVLDYVDPTWHDPLLHCTPLWYYVLAEAASPRGERGAHLGPVGGRIVAEVLLGIIEGDSHSYLSQAPAWRPELDGATKGDFTMVDLVNFATRPVPAAPG